MPDGYLSVAIDEMPQLYDGFFKLVRTGLGITA